VFEPFFTTKGGGEGSGLGLSMVYGFVEQSGGFVTLDSRPGAGTTVTIHLPRSRAPEARPARAAPRAAKPVDRELWILLVEDEAEVRRLIERFLKSLGYGCVSAASAAEALERLGDGTDVALLLTDVVLPDKNGIELAAAARELQPELPVLYISGYAEDLFATSARGGAHVLAKPFSRADLAERLTQLLAEPAQNASVRSQDRK